MSDSASVDVRGVRQQGDIGIVLLCDVNRICYNGAPLFNIREPEMKQYIHYVDRQMQYFYI